jgi:hypothetical protein
MPTRAENHALITSLMCHDQIKNREHSMLESLAMARLIIADVETFISENPHLLPARTKGPMKKGKGKRKGCK